MSLALQTYDFPASHITDGKSINTWSVMTPSPLPLLDDDESLEDLESSAHVGANPAEISTLADRQPRIQISFIAEQEWEGYVTEVCKDHFSAILIDLNDKSTEEFATFPNQEISSIHSSLLKEGAVFRWSIGYERLRGGTRKKVSSIVFRRLPAWTSKDISKSVEETATFQANITWE